MKNYFILVRDEDGHWYVIPKDKHEAFYDWIGSSEYQDGIEPDYAKRVGGAPSLVRFTGYVID